MDMKFVTKSSLLLLLTLSSVLLIPAYCDGSSHHEEQQSAEKDLFDCFRKCASRRQRNDGKELDECGKECVKHFQQRKEREKEQEGRSHERRGGGGEDYVGKEQGEKGEKRREVGTGSDNPYYFDSQRFASKYRTEEGHVRVLERFSKNSNLLQGIENYRLAILEANPNTFVVPHHCDAESVLVVVRGKGTISYIRKNQRQSYNLKEGDAIRVRAGSLVYLINDDDNEKLRVLKLLQPVNIPGRFEEFFGAGGENPESFYKAFSTETLQAAFNAPRERLDKVFGKQQKGVIVKASKEQIRTLTQQSESSAGRSRRRGEAETSWGPFNIREARPLFSNQFGNFYEAFPKEIEQLRDLDVSVAFMNINKGGMTAPYYNSQSTKLVYVARGSGKFELACPHLSAQRGRRHGGSEESEQGKEQQEESRRTGTHYERVAAQFSAGDAFVIPAGHPVVITADQGSNLQLIGFGIRASHNKKHFLAGRENVWNEVEDDAKELAFSLPGQEVEEIFRRQEQSYFLPGPGQTRRGHGGNTVVGSILDFAGF